MPSSGLEPIPMAQQPASLATIPDGWLFNRSVKQALTEETRAANRVNVHCTLHPIRESNLLALSRQKLFKFHHPNEEHKPRLPDSIAQPITNKPLSRMENTTFAKPSITDSHDIGLRTVYSPDAQKKTPIQRLFTKENAY
ncbi:hypothetical protein TNCV_1287771 [Trichonephila clavipes]|nr:hypothetical protein TNCV_1287771 [Trichonephila clavipes]